MDFYAMLEERAAEGRPVEAALIDAGKLGAVLLAQARLAPGLHVFGFANPSVARAAERR